MAGNLIPPPSPAGKPDPARHFSSESLRSKSEDVEEQLEDALEEAVPPPPSRFQGRFGLITGGLIGLGIAAAAIVVLLLANGTGPEPQWSKWQPEYDDRNLQLIEIGRYVSAGYRLDDGDQLNQAEGQDISSGESPIRVALRTAGKGEGASIEEIYGRTALYTMRGLGPGGSIDSGKPTEARLRLLQRESLEIALYTFTYVKGVDNVILLLPPSPENGEKSQTDGEGARITPGTLAMFFRPGDLEAALKAPLEATFPEGVDPPRPSTISEDEQTTYALLSETHLFNASIEADQLGSSVLVLTRSGAAEAVQEAIEQLKKA